MRIITDMRMGQFLFAIYLMLWPLHINLFNFLSVVIVITYCFNFILIIYQNIHTDLSIDSNSRFPLFGISI